jgi:hypothetical protein
MSTSLSWPKARIGGVWYLGNNNNNGYSALEPVWQEPEPSQATGMALVRCILGMFLEVVCHCFPPSIT